MRSNSSITTMLLAVCIAFLPVMAQTEEEENVIGMEGWVFNPTEKTIKAGETVIWLNDDDTNHNIAFIDEVENAPTMEKPKKVRKTKRYSLTFPKPGVYNYVCKIHLDYDMKGVIIVK